MSLGLAILLGIIQGLTEFLPVSSSGHLALFGTWFGLGEPDLTFDILVHLATLAAIMVYFRHDWLQLGQMLLKRESGDLPPKVLQYLIISMVPAGLIGVFFKDQVEWFHHHPFWVGLFLLVTAALLLPGLKKGMEGKTFAEMGWAVVIAMSLAQACAIMPGISRSGATIMLGIYLGMQRRAAARFSFLMAVPVIGGAGVLAAKDLLDAPPLSSELMMAYGAGFVAALVSGFFALAFMMRLLDGRRFFLFGFYCLGLGLAAMIV
jgi:undecaprenyl-diphosphatase